MSTKQLMNGGVVSPTSIYYWGVTKTTVATDATTMFYRIGPNGTMTQTCRVPVRGEIKISGTYKTVDLNGILLFKVTATFSDSGSIEETIILENEVLNTWSYFELSIDVPDAKEVISIRYDISFTGQVYGAIANLSSITQMTNVTGGISADDFIQKAITYGLDEDKPLLGVEEGVDD